MIVGWIWAACASERPVVAPQPPVSLDGYRARLADIEAQRLALASARAGRDEARAFLFEAVTEQILPSWMGTDWDFYGTSDTPRQGAIACGHFVGTVLRDAGFRVDRLALGRLPSEIIVDLFASPAEKRRFRGRSSEEVASALLALPQGLYAVGLDFHTGLLVRGPEGLAFCNASPWSGVVCEDPVQSPDFASKYRVVGPVLTDRAIDRWLAGEEIAIPSGW